MNKKEEKTVSAVEVTKAPADKTLQLYQKIAKVQYKVATNIKKEAKNGYYGTKYATYNDIMVAVVPELEANKLFITTNISYDVMKTKVIDTETGEFAEYELNMNFEKTVDFKSKSIKTSSDGSVSEETKEQLTNARAFSGTPQDFGSLITYYKRYQICGIFGIAPSDDDDGEMAQKKYRKMEMMSSTEEHKQKENVPQIEVIIEKTKELKDRYKIPYEIFMAEKTQVKELVVKHIEARGEAVSDNTKNFIDKHIIPQIEYLGKETFIKKVFATN